MAMLLLVREMDDVNDRMEALVKTHAMRRGVNVAWDSRIFRFGCVHG
jgi:hypothetical protein